MKVKGNYRERTYEKDGKSKIVRELVVKSLEIERRKIRKPAV